MKDEKTVESRRSKVEFKKKKKSRTCWFRDWVSFRFRLKPWQVHRSRM